MASTCVIHPTFRLLAAALALVLTAAACGSGTDLDGDGGGEAAGDDGDDGSGSDGDDADAPPASGACAIDDDCVAVSSTCCECPTFAVVRGSPYAEACNQVKCELPDNCSAVEAVCGQTGCELVCQPVIADLEILGECQLGFERDRFGCLLAACHQGVPDSQFSCKVDKDCAQVQADCCGCRLGGADTAVAVSAVEAYLESLGCTSNPSCPGRDVCDASLEPRCIAQTCMLAPIDDEGSGDDGDGDGDGASPSPLFCGVPEYPSCPMGQVCVLNHPDSPDANRMGVGSCHDPEPVP